MTRKYDTYKRVKINQIVAEFGLKAMLVLIAAIFPFAIRSFLSSSGIALPELPTFQAEGWFQILEVQSEDLTGAILWSVYTIIFLGISCITRALLHDDLQDARRNNPPDDFSEMLEQVSEAEKVEGKLRALFISRWILSAALLFDMLILAITADWFMSLAGLVLGGVSTLFAMQTCVFSALDVARRAIDHAAKQRDENKRRTLDR